MEAAERALACPLGRLAATERGRLLARLSELILARVEDLARIEAIDVGKPLAQGRADAIAMARYMEFHAGAADKATGETIPYLDGYTVYTLREPHGVTGHIVPWSYPLQIAGLTIGAALAMGNACVLKPAEEACLTSLALGRPAADAARQGAARGHVFLNNYGAGGGVELPFGGMGKSGHGREKGFEALTGFSTLNTVAAWHG